MRNGSYNRWVIRCTLASLSIWVKWLKFASLSKLVLPRWNLGWCKKLASKRWAHLIVKKGEPPAGNSHFGMIEYLIGRCWRGGVKGRWKRRLPVVITLGLSDWIIPVCIIHFWTDDNKKKINKKPHKAFPNITLHYTAREITRGFGTI